MTEISKKILLDYVPDGMKNLPESLRVIYGFLVMTTTFEYSEKGEYKYNIGCHWKASEIANVLGWCERYVYRALGILYKFKYIDYQGEIFFVKYFKEN